MPPHHTIVTLDMIAALRVLAVPVFLGVIVVVVAYATAPPGTGHVVGGKFEVGCRGRGNMEGDLEYDPGW